MTENSQGCHMDSQEDQHKLQDAEIRAQLERIGTKILVMSGKGGVGKSSVAAYLSVILARRGCRVGLMDVDLHGPSIPRLLGLHGDIEQGEHGKARPIRYLPNMEVISIESLMGEQTDTATIWRGPLKIGVIRQFISDIDWMDLDFLFIDSPPGTGDEPLTVVQTIPDAKALIVTTPQEISLADVRKSINFCRQVNMEILGLVENMSGLKCPHCGEMIDIFKTHGGRLTARNEGLTLLGTLPFEPEVVLNGDSGSMSFLDNAQHSITRELNRIADEIMKLRVREKDVSLEAQEKLRGENNALDGARMFVVPVSDGKLAAHFGHCEQFAFIRTENGKIMGKEMRTAPPHEPGVIPRWLSEEGADVAIVGGMGEQAQQLLRQNGVEVVVGAPQDTPESLVKQYLSGILVAGENACDH